jgi:hypothetical protein
VQWGHPSVYAGDHLKQNSKVEMNTFLKMEEQHVSFSVPDMVCERDARAVSAALTCADPGATLVVDRSTRVVEIAPSSARPIDFRRAIRSVGFESLRRWPAEIQFALSDPLFADRGTHRVM